MLDIFLKNSFDRPGPTREKNKRVFVIQFFELFFQFFCNFSIALYMVEFETAFHNTTCSSLYIDKIGRYYKIY
jgi:hypothetical protein